MLSIAIVVGVAAIRLALGGWDAMSPDHARYVYAGLSLLDDRGYVNEAGAPFLIRSPTYPVLVGGTYRLAGSDGAHAVAWALGLGALLLTVVLAARLGGAAAAAAAALSVVAVPLFWQQIVSIGIDMPQAGLYLATLLLLLRPTRIRWLAAGAVLGLAMLVKETVAPAVVLLPIAWLPPWSELGWRRWATLTLLFGGATAVIAGWWWVLVWRETGLVFPLNSLEAIVRDEAPAIAQIRPAMVLAAAVAIGAWTTVVIRRWRDPGVRVLAAAALSLAPAAMATVLLAQPARNLGVAALLTCVAIGVATAELGSWAKGHSRTGWRAVGVVLSAILVGAAAIGQSVVTPASEDLLPARIAELARRGLAPRDAIVSTFRYRSALGVEVFDLRVSVRLVPIAAVARAGDPGRFLWLGERRGTLFGLSRDGWERSLGSQRAAYLVIAGPHPLSPTELLPALRSSSGRDAGLTHLGELRGPTGRADVFEVDPEHVVGSWRLRLHAQAGALNHWLDLAELSGDTDAAEALVATGPIVPARSSEVRTLADRLGQTACFRRQREAGIVVLQIERADGQADCLSGSALEGG